MRDEFCAMVRHDVCGYAVLGEYVEEEELCKLGQGDGVVCEMNCERQRPNSGSPPLSMLSYRRSWSLTVP